jgi:3-oxoadipate enol-lactonase
VVVVGHSLGALISLHLAAEIPQTVKALVLFGPVKPPPEPGQTGLSARAESVRQGGMGAVADTIVGNAFATESFKSRKAEVALAREMLTRQSSDGYASACEALKTSTLPQFQKITGQVIVLSGEEDKVSTIAVGQSVVSEIGKHAEQVTLAKVGHWHMLEAPAQCIEAIKKATK